MSQQPPAHHSEAASPRDNRNRHASKLITAKVCFDRHLAGRRRLEHSTGHVCCWWCPGKSCTVTWWCVEGASAASKRSKCYWFLISAIGFSLASVLADGNSIINALHSVRGVATPVASTGPVGAARTGRGILHGMRTGNMPTATQILQQRPVVDANANAPHIGASQVPPPHTLLCPGAQGSEG